MTAPRIRFSTLTGFPDTFQSGKIKLDEFLVASQEIIKIIESFGKLYRPIVNDMQGNHDKLKKFYENSARDVEFLEDLILKDLENTQNDTKLSLLWLKRALELIERFFTYILEDDKSETEDLKTYLRRAYTDSLQPYHGYLLQKTFNLLSVWLPTKSTLLGTEELYQENIKQLHTFLPKMKMHLDKINQFYEDHKLNDLSKV